MRSVSFVCLSKESWANPRRARKQLLFEALLKQSGVEEVLYVDPAGHFGRSHVKPVPNLTGMRICERGYILKGERFALVRAINRWILYLSLRKELKRYTRWHTFFYNPWDLKLAKFLSPYGPTLFDWTEDWAVYHDNTLLGAEQKSAIEFASGIIVATESLADRARELSNGKKKILFLPNATAWKPMDNLKCPEEMRRIPFPRVGYIGHLGPWFDEDLVFALSCARPDWHWVMIGQADNTAKELFQARENVHLLGRRPFASLQAYMAQCQVLVAPYKKNVEGDSSKLYDYLTLGHPIISSEIQTARRLQPYVQMASGPQFWLQALEEALLENNTAASQARQTASLQHTWDVRASSLRRWLEGLKNA